MAFFDPKHCLWGVSVHLVTTIISILQIVFYSWLIIYIIFYISTDSPTHDIIYWLVLGFFILELSTSGLLLVGRITSRSVFYLPFVIVNAICLIIFYLLTVVYLVLGLILFTGALKGSSYIELGILPYATIFLIVFVTLSVVYTYVLSIVIRSYRLMEKESARLMPENLDNLIN